jgi:hypothetical protein
MRRKVHPPVVVSSTDVALIWSIHYSRGLSSPLVRIDPEKVDVGTKANAGPNFGTTPYAIGQ